MNEFTSQFWEWWIIVPTVLGIAACYALVRWMLTPGTTPPGEEAESMGHVWDGNLEELNNPLPRWWLNMFYITIIFGVIYLILYPGLGSFAGVLNWTSTGQYEKEMQTADDKYGPIFKHYASQDIETLIKDEEAVAVGRRMFINYCSVCHGTDARGGPGFPDLTDGESLYGGTPEAIKTSILAGRNGMMPPMADAVGGEEGVEQVAAYVMSLSGREVDATLAAAGKEKFAACGACHMPDGTGNEAMGAPNLTDKTWLYGGSPGAIKKAITEGRQGVMPAHEEFLGADKSHIIAAYIYSLSANK